MNSTNSNKELVDKLTTLLQDANKKILTLDSSVTFGKCEWVDINGDQRCNSPWSKFQCEQVDGTFFEGESCEQ